jgi:hypothetical protein
MNHLIAFDAQERCSEDSFRLGVYQNFHKSVRLAFLHCAANARHRTFSDQRFPP